MGLMVSLYRSLKVLSILFLRKYTLKDGVIIRGENQDGSEDFKYTYNSDGRLMGADLTSVNKGYISTITWNQDNITQLDDLTLTYTFDYLTNMEFAHPLFLYPNIFENDSDPVLLLEGYFGQKPLNTPEKIGDTKIHYTYDDENRVIALTTDEISMKFYREGCQ